MGLLSLATSLLLVAWLGLVWLGLACRVAWLGLACRVAWLAGCWTRLGLATSLPDSRSGLRCCTTPLLPGALADW